MCVTKKRDNASEDGLTIVEVLVAITLLVVVLLVVERGAVAALQAASVAKQHSEATSLVSQTVAQAESLGFGDLWAGLDSSAENLSQDPNIATTGSGSGTTYALKLDNATIATCSTETSETPLVPHINTVSDGISYQVAAYPIASSSCSTSPSPPANGTVTLVVIVNWKSAVGGQGQVVGQTEISAP